jgi:hypothetical protein
MMKGLLALRALSVAVGTSLKSMKARKGSSALVAANVGYRAAKWVDKGQLRGGTLSFMLRAGKAQLRRQEQTFV